MHFGELFSIIKPVSPSFITSGIAPTGVARTGVPQTIASSTMFGRKNIGNNEVHLIQVFEEIGTVGEPHSRESINSTYISIQLPEKPFSMFSKSFQMNSYSPQVAVRFL